MIYSHLALPLQCSAAFNNASRGIKKSCFVNFVVLYIFFSEKYYIYVKEGMDKVA